MNKWTPSQDPSTWLAEWTKQAEDHTKAKVTSYPVCNSLALVGIMFLSSTELSKLGQKNVMKALTLEMRLLDIISSTPGLASVNVLTHLSQPFWPTP